MADSGAIERESGSQKRGVGRGGGFFLIDRLHWEKLWKINTVNRLNLVTAYLVLSAGTGADHRLTKWSAKACEERAGMGKPRAKVAIDELIAAELAGRTQESTANFPQYRLAEHKSSAEPIFLPVALVTGLANETPVLRRVRETGDPLILRMLIDLYGLIQIDPTHGISADHLTEFDNRPESSRKIAEMGSNAIWALSCGGMQQAKGKWTDFHWAPTAGKDGWAIFWERVKSLRTIGAIWFEPWVFSGIQSDAEPLFPIAPVGRNNSSPIEKDVSFLSEIANEAAEVLIGERSYLINQNEGRSFIVMPTHHQVPLLRGVARLKVEADTPGRRLAYARRKQAIEQYTQSCSELVRDAKAGVFSHPIRLPG